ncbi:membrane protein [Lysinibacillus alkalisoli]|uniref:Membrane protein n=1 Tax=Lysinibacillus alkalisoli TaxID=1911548 RepID=A0A917FZU4_9BACI|nr:YitT family protein [Lysinibacillus alkalisoli]GGG15787.1 membrane protein [Lysinibacillus alkalisoli]
MKKFLYDLVMLIIGSFIFALAINLFAIPNELGEGGVTGITIIAYYLFQWAPSIVSFILNAILLVIGYKFLSRKTVIYTIIVICFLSIFLHFTESWAVLPNERIIAAVFGGVFAGVGIGLIIRVGGTTAGSTILAKIASKYLGWSVSYALLFFDLIVVGLSYFVIGFEALLLTVIMLYVGTKTMEFVIEGLNHKKAVTIISSEHDKIAEKVTYKMNRGVTVLSGYGYYTKERKDVLYIIISSQEIVKLKNYVKDIDQHAFITVHDVRDVFGEGFIDLSKS